MRPGMTRRCEVRSEVRISHALGPIQACGPRGRSLQGTAFGCPSSVKVSEASLFWWLRPGWLRLTQAAGVALATRGRRPRAGDGWATASRLRA